MSEGPNESEDERVMTDRGERIVRAKMKSKDGVIQGEITYDPPLISSPFTDENAQITAEFNFNSEDESLKPEYQGLSKLLREM